MEYHLSKLDKINIENIKAQNNFKKSYAVSHAKECQDENCEFCQHLCDEGLVESCDSCGQIGHTDVINFWTGKLEGDKCFIYCPKCKNNI